VSGTQIFAQDVLVAAASDMAPVMQELSKDQRFRLKVSIGSSGQLARQIEHGAPFDVFLSADEALILGSPYYRAETVRVYGTGRLALWAKSGNFKSLPDLAGAGRIAIANPAHAPYGRAARAALESAGLWKPLQPRIVLAESVRQTLQFGETGNVDAILTAWSLVKGKGGILLDQELRQAGAVTRSSKYPEAARAFLDFLMSEAGQALLARHGFMPPRK
jgi:molybdate transport system substrate-binding protein